MLHSLWQSFLPSHYVLSLPHSISIDILSEVKKSFASLITLALQLLLYSFFFWGGAQWLLGGYSWFCAQKLILAGGGDHMWWQGSSPGQSCARPTSYLLFWLWPPLPLFLKHDIFIENWIWFHILACLLRKSNTLAHIHYMCVDVHSQ